MRVGIVANIEDPEAGYVEERLEALDAHFVRRWRSDPETLAGFETEVDLLVLLGSDWSVYERAYAREIGAERDLVTRATAAGCPTLGICFGGQLIASSLGLSVERAPRGEIGWVTIESDDRALISEGPWFQYHRDRWVPSDVHPGIARNAAAPQAVVVGRTLGTQFHPEVTEDVIERWVRNGAHDLAATGSDGDQIARETEGYIEDSQRRCHALVDAFLTFVAEAPIDGSTAASRSA